MEFILPDIGEGVHEGEITKWLIKPGDSIQADQPMVEVMTDKATVEIPSPVAGTVEELFAKEGQTVEVGKPIVRIQEGTGKAAPAPKPASETKPSPPIPAVSPRPQPSAAPRAPERREQAMERKEQAASEPLPFNILATPATRRLARDLSVDLGQIQGTGPHGRVTKEDVKATQGRPSASQGHEAPAAARPCVSLLSRGPSREDQRIPLKGVRKKIAEAMARSTHTAAHFSYVDEVDMTEIVSLRASVKDEATRRGIKLTYLPFVIKAVIPALMEFPFFNASLDDEKQEIIVKKDYNIGIATDTPSGLFVPVVKGADGKGLWELAAEISALSERARTGKSSLDDLKGGTFTLTNAGSIGGAFTTPVINHPEVAILGVNAIKKRPVVKDGQIAIRDMMYLSISVDHRVVDGADAARFVNRIIYYLSDLRRLVFV